MKIGSGSINAMNMNAIVRKLFSVGRSENKKLNQPKDYEWERYQAFAKQQFVKLKEKGLQIPIITL